MLGLFWLLIIAVLVAVVVWYFNGGGTNRPSSAPGVRQPSIFNLQLGDIVQYQGTDWFVEDKLTYSQSGWEWIEYLLQDGDRIAFLSVDDDDTLEVDFTETVKDCIVEQPPQEQITYQQKIYNKEESGTAQLTRLRKPGRVETCQYYDYAGPDEAVLSVEMWEGEMEVSVGQAVRPYQLTFLPGDGQSVHRGDA